MAKKKSNEKVTRKPVAAPRKAVAAKPRKAIPPVKATPTRKRHPKRDLAKTMFLAADMTATDISVQLGIQLKTIGAWRKEDNWDDERTLCKVTPVAIRKQILESIAAILKLAKEENRTLTDAEADSIGKLNKAAKDFLNEISPQIILEVLYAFIWDDLDQRDHELALKVSPISLDYVNKKLNEAKHR